MFPCSIAVILINWNGQADTLECLQSLRQTVSSSLQQTVIVVDNGSSDDSVSAIRQAFPEVTVLETGENLGFTGGNNFGIRHAVEKNFDFLFLLNNDTTLEATALENLVKAAHRHPEFGILTPLIFYYDHPQAPWFVGSILDLEQGVAVHDNRVVPDPENGVQELPWASGCAMLIRADVMKQLEGFDDRYFLNWEDVDLSLRARALGTRIGIVPTAVIQHKVNRSFRGISQIGYYYYVRNNLLLIRSHCSRPRIATRHVLNSRLRENLKNLVGRQPNAWQLALATVRAVKDHCQQHYGPISSG